MGTQVGIESFLPQTTGKEKANLTLEGRIIALRQLQPLILIANPLLTFICFYSVIPSFHCWYMYTY